MKRRRSTEPRVEFCDDCGRVYSAEECARRIRQREIDRIGRRTPLRLL